MACREKTHDNTNQLPKRRRWSLRLVFLDGEVLKSCLLARKKEQIPAFHRIKKNGHLQPAVSKEIIRLELQHKPPGEGSAVKDQFDMQLQLNFLRKRAWC